MTEQNKKIDEILEIVQEERALNNSRFSDVSSRFSQMSTRIDEVLEIVRDERGLNNARFSQTSSSLEDLRKDIHRVETTLKSEIDKVYDSLSEDIQAIAGDLTNVKVRVTKLEKKIA